MHRITSILLISLISWATSKPIMVTFGTNQGPIIPRQETTTPEARVDINPAPVFERPEDVPNPSVYKPLVPHQYRRKIYSFKPHPNLILGTPLDVKYTPSLNKYTHHKRQVKALGIGYTGPQIFEKQDYEYDLEKRASPSLVNRRESSESRDYHRGNQKNLVPQIGVIYSSGLRYYVPQIVDNSSSEEDSNSVYDRNDSKYYDYRNQNYY